MTEPRSRKRPFATSNAASSSPNADSAKIAQDAIPGDAFDPSTLALRAAAIAEAVGVSRAVSVERHTDAASGERKIGFVSFFVSLAVHQLYKVGCFKGK